MVCFSHHSLLTITYWVNTQLVLFWLVKASSRWLLKDPRGPSYFPCFFVNMVFQTTFIDFFFCLKSLIFPRIQQGYFEEEKGKNNPGQILRMAQEDCYGLIGTYPENNQQLNKETSGLWPLSIFLSLSSPPASTTHTLIHTKRQSKSFMLVALENCEKLKVISNMGNSKH